MNCPTCGTAATTDQQFCRTCGMSLEIVAKLVAQHVAMPAEIQKRLDKRKAEQALVRSMFNWIIWGMIILGIGVVLSVFNKTFEIGKWFKVLSSLTVLSGVGIATAGVLNTMRQGIQLTGKRPTLDLGTTAEPQNLPTNPFPTSLPSVTERTTQLISKESDN